MLSSTTPTTVLVATCLDFDDTKQLLSWAINILCHPNDTVVAIHVLVGKEPKKFSTKSLDYKQFRRAKSFLLSVMGEFAKICQKKQVHLEARVRYSSSIGSCLIDEAKRTSAEFLLLGGSNIQPKGKSGEVIKYCTKHAPKGCSVISTRKLPKEVLNLSKNDDENEKSDKKSPRTVLEGTEGESCGPSTEDDTSSFGDSSSNSESPPPQPLQPPPPAAAAVVAEKVHKQSPLMRVASFFLRRRNSERCSIEAEKLYQPALRCFSFYEISLATRDFHPDNMVGQGGYSEVYKGEVSEGNMIAVKRLAKDNSNPQKEKDFLMELGIICHVSHPNTASVIGYCVENGLYLVFQFSPNGNLFTALHGNTSKSLEWEMRYKITLGIARGLHYLHKCCKHRIIHRDIKASNVLLGPDYEPQITDFGLAKWIPSKCNNNHAILPIEGTFGYLAPEYFMHGIVDEKTDVFAFGILLLEIVTGRRPIDSSKQSLLLWAMPLMESGKISELVDPRLSGKFDEEQVQRVVLIASCCVRQASTWRPSMIEVLELLENVENRTEMAKKWGLQRTTSGEVDDYSMVFGYNVPIDTNLERAVAALEI